MTTAEKLDLMKAKRDQIKLLQAEITTLVQEIMVERGEEVRSITPLFKSEIPHDAKAEDLWMLFNPTQWDPFD